MLMGVKDAFFENVCELDLVFNFYKVRFTLSSSLPGVTDSDSDETTGLRDLGRDLPCGRDRRNEQGCCAGAVG